MLKVYRRLQPGPHPEIEMARFLVERAGFANTPPLLGTIEMRSRRPRARSATTMALGVLFGFVRNQGDGWTHGARLSLALSRRRAERGRARRDTARPAPNCPTRIISFWRWRASSGCAPREMHRALAEHGGDDPAFAPEPITAGRHRRSGGGELRGSGRRTCSRELRARARDRLAGAGAGAGRSA